MDRLQLRALRRRRQFARDLNRARRRYSSNAAAYSALGRVAAQWFDPEVSWEEQPWGPQTRRFTYTHDPLLGVLCDHAACREMSRRARKQRASKE